MNLVSSPGSGKTTLLARTVQTLRAEFPVAVIGATNRPPTMPSASALPACRRCRSNTGKGCHLDAHGIGHALERLPLPEQGLLFIENVGQLVCPADFDLGEACKVVVLIGDRGRG
ncbi:MAG: GTP-binding protein [Candidatus Competibacteraceae bacterium]